MTIMKQVHDETKTLQQPLVAWSYRVPKQFKIAFILQAIKDHPNNGIREIQRILEKTFRESAPSVYTVSNVVKHGVANRWVDKFEMGKTVQVSITEEGISYITEIREWLLELIQLSTTVLDKWERSLYPMGLPGEIEVGPTDLFEEGGLKELHRTLILHLISNRKAKDPLTNETRPFYLFEIFREFEERYGWRASDALITNVKDEMSKESAEGREPIFISTRLEMLKVPSQRSLTGVMDSHVEFLSITADGRERLERGLITTWGVLRRTRWTLQSWQTYLKESGR